jgi:hypothetical protein
MPYRFMRATVVATSAAESATRRICGAGWELLTEHCTYSGDSVRLVFGRQDRPAD